MTPDGYAGLGSGEGATIDEALGDSRDTGLSWGKAVQKSGLNGLGAVVVAMLRLLGWHLMQPTLYWWALWSYWDIIDHLQLIFGVIVGVREGIYALLCFIAVCVRPAYLLVDVMATATSATPDKRIAIWLYVLAPEKFVIACVMSWCNLNGICIAISSALLDVSAVAAIVAACVSGITPPRTYDWVLCDDT